MANYKPEDLKQKATAILAKYPAVLGASDTYGSFSRRRLLVDHKTIGNRVPMHRGKDFIKLLSSTPNSIKNPAEAESGISLSSVEQLVEPGQARLIAELLYVLSQRGVRMTVQDLVQVIVMSQAQGGLDSLTAGNPMLGDLVETRPLDIAAAVNRLRGLSVE